MTTTRIEFAPGHEEAPDLTAKLLKMNAAEQMYDALCGYEALLQERAAYLGGLSEEMTKVRVAGAAALAAAEGRSHQESV